MKMLNSIREWWWNRKFNQAKKALGVMIANGDPEICNELQRAAEAIARQMCMRWLDNRRINHCSVCPNTGTLLAVHGRYYCKGHFPKDAKSGLSIVGGNNAA